MTPFPSGPYSIIYADPPWRYDFAKGKNREIESHYPTMELAEICSLPVWSISADDAILFLWATAPKLEDALQVVRAWGFEYKTNMAWIKDKIGMGYYVRGQHELLLIAIKGNFPHPGEHKRPSSVYRAPRREHSQKPAGVRDLIISMCGDLPRIELFNRGPKPYGWQAWGNETEIVPTLESYH